MAAERARPRAPPFIDPPGYFRHRPEATLLYALVERHIPSSSPRAKPLAGRCRSMQRIFAHRRERGEEETLTVALGARAPPQAPLF